MIHLETSRLILRDWQDSDIALFAEMNKDKEVRKFFPSLLTSEESAQSVARIKNHFKEHGFGLFAVELKSTKEFIGFVGLSTPSFKAHFTPCVEIGWRLAKAYWHQGYAIEAAQAVLLAAFEKYGLKEVVSFTAAQNEASIHVMKKLGMQHNPNDDFKHPDLPEDHPLSAHVLYRISAEQLRAQEIIRNKN